jgi:hypothetical protein
VKFFSVLTQFQATTGSNYKLWSVDTLHKLQHLNYIVGVERVKSFISVYCVHSVRKPTGIVMMWMYEVKVIYYMKEIVYVESLCVLFVRDGVERRPRCFIR